MPGQHPSVKGLRIGLIRTRLLVAFVALVLLPAISISISSVWLGLQSGQRQVLNQLHSVATLKASQVSAWIDMLQSNLAGIVYPHQVARLVDPLMQEEPDSAAYRAAERELLVHLARVVEETPLFEELSLLDTQGRTLLSTNRSTEGEVHSIQQYFLEGLRGDYFQALTSVTSQGQSPLVMSRPVVNLDNEVRAVLVGRADLGRLNAIMLQRAGLGNTGETYLVGPTYRLLTESRFGSNTERVRTEIVELALQTRSDGGGLYTNYRDTPVVGVYRWLPRLEMILIAEQKQSEAFAAIYNALFVNLSVAAIAVLIALATSRLVALGISRPLASLARTATRIASGSLELSADAGARDEIGELARAFNSMTTQLRGLIGNLEQHVKEVNTLNDRLQSELHLARTIQQSLLPPARPEWNEKGVVCYNMPARAVGGDLYVYHLFDSQIDSASNGNPITWDGKYAVAVGDVSGKGMPAALLMAVSLASFRSLINQGLTPAAFLAQMDTTIADYTRSTRQNCAFVYVEISQSHVFSGNGHSNSESYTLCVANAGCVNPLIKRSGGRVEWVDVGGLPLGVGLGARMGYQEATLDIVKGDLIILTSDGVVETYNAAGEMFSFERLERAVASGPQTSAEAMLDHLQATIATFGDQTDLHDDVTIVVVQV